MKKIAYLASRVTLPGSPIRRTDAFEHDNMMDALRGPFEARGYRVEDVAWDNREADWSAFEAAIIGTTWDYWDRLDEFLTALERIEGQTRLFNGSALVRWNSRKTYLQALGESGAPTIPTLWLDNPDADAIRAAFAHFGCEKLVVKRQIGAGVEGQLLIEAGALPGPGWRYGHAAMVQPFLPAITRDGEVSLIFIDGQFSHALRKIAATGDYRIQSLYGGREEDFHPAPADIAAAEAIIAALPFPAPLYARIDMLRSDEGTLLLMEAEMIEPYLYPEQGPQLGECLAAAIARRLDL